MMKRITVTISEVTEAKLKEKKPEYLSLSKYINMILESSLDNLDSLVRLPAYRVGAEETSTNKDVNTSTPVNEDKVHFESSNFSSKEKNLKNSISILGEDVGRESEGNPKNTPLPYDFETSIPDKLKPYSDKIASFWRVKKGTKNRLAWSLQMGELEKILDNLGKKVLVEQLDQACMAGTWQQINYNRTVKWSDKAEEVKQNKHPAHKVFKASDLGW
tara:strand:- start:1394 stop:2044 length:651 start_codon:yes stop_codon:yes gene_type:complete